jgi:UDP-N-acetylmuramoyl-L-alanyl-D-glutamate--2,6-diaminopimelate ligase
LKPLAAILADCPVLATTGPLPAQVGELRFDSRLVQPGDVFVAIRGTHTDGHQHIGTAVAQGAAVVVGETAPANLTVPFVQVAHSGLALGYLAANYYGRPANQLKLVGITGTNGKTTTVTLLHRLFTALGYRAGLVSTVENKIGSEVLPSTHTTPDSLALNALLAQMVAAGCTHAFMEVSSHALVQGRVAGVKFAGALFSNISHDHLDYHGTFDEYIRAKKLFFDGLDKTAFALVNKDDKRGAVMLQNTAATTHTFALKSPADYKGKVLANNVQGLEMEVDGHHAWFKLMGEFNAYNLLGIYGAAVLLGQNPERVLTELSRLDSATGRFDRVLAANGTTAIVDYAHTPDALRNVLQTIAQLRRPGQKITTVVGCGGNRDAAKRPLMAAIACELSDAVILTSDNPRHEDPLAILADMQRGVTPEWQAKVQTLPDRREAIAQALAQAQPGDIVLVAGKGHESYQEIAGVKHPFDDKLIIEEIFKTVKN